MRGHTHTGSAALCRSLNHSRFNSVQAPHVKPHSLIEAELMMRSPRLPFSGPTPVPRIRSIFRRVEHLNYLNGSLLSILVRSESLKVCFQEHRVSDILKILIS